MMRFDGAWSQHPTSLASQTFSGCALRGADIFLTGTKLFRKTNQNLVEETVSDVLPPHQQWRGVMESGGEVFAFGTGFRVAQRKADGAWRVIRVLDPTDSYLFQAATALPGGDVLFVGFTDDGANPTNGTVVLLVLSFSTSEWLVSFVPSDFSAYAVAATSATDFVLAGGHRNALGGTTGDLERWTR
ncbi:MAG: hypothetical protein AB1938_18685 [Myxococcota bacterium]